VSRAGLPVRGDVVLTLTAVRARGGRTSSGPLEGASLGGTMSPIVRQGTRRAHRRRVALVLVALISPLPLCAAGQTSLAAAAVAAAPSAPTAAAATTSGASATLTWAPPTSNGGSAVTAYVVGRDGKDSTGYGAWSGRVSATSRSATFNQLVPGATYRLTVRAVTASGEGPASTVTVTMTSATATPSAPRSVTATAAATGGTATVAWAPPQASGGGPVTGYRVARDGVDVKGTGAWSTTVAASARQFTFGNLVAGRTYTFTVQAVSSLGTGASAAAKVVVPTVSPSGQAMPAGDLPGWRQVFAEDFSANLTRGSWPGAYAGRFEPYDWGTPDTAKQGIWKTSKVFSAQGGLGDYYLHSENGVPMGAALIPKVGGKNADQVYGRFSVRFKVDPGLDGWSSAWLLWPQEDDDPTTREWPDRGEIDWPEGELTGNIQGFMHYANPNGGQDSFDSGVPFAGAWHTASTEWTPGLVKFYLDDRLVGSTTRQVPSGPMHWVLQSETAYGEKPTTSGHIAIDWVVQYSRA
jgi:hypothetical protein